MFAPFNIRHEKTFTEPSIADLVETIKDVDKRALDAFAKACIKYATNNDISVEVRDLAVDVAICTRDFKSVLDLTETFSNPEYFLYRAYAFTRLNMTNKIVSLKLQFQQKYGDSLNTPKNLFITGALEFLLLYGEQNYPMALTTVEEIEEHAAVHEDVFDKNLSFFLILTLASQAYLLINNFEKVELLARRVLQFAVHQNDPYFQSVALNLITTVFINKGEFKKAQKILNAAIIPTEETGLAADRASLLNNAAKLELARGDFERSIRLLRQIHELVSKNPRAKAVSATNIAELSLLLENYEDAKEMLDVALQLEDEYELNLIQPYLLSAWIAVERDNFDLAEKSLLLCKQKLDEVGELRVKPNIYYLEGMLFQKKGMITEAIQAFEISNKSASELDNIEYLIKAQFQLASVHLDRFNETKELNDYSAVLSYLNNLTYLSEEQFIPRLMCDIQLLKGLLLVHGGKEKKAIEAIEEAYDLAKKFNYPKVQREARTFIQEIDKEKKLEKFASILEEKGFQQSNRMSEVVKKYQGFKFVKTPKHIESKLYGIAIVEADSAVMKYRFTTKHEYKDEASLVPMLVAALNIFSQSVLEEDLVLSEVRQQERELLINLVGDFIIIAITERITFNLKNQFEKYTETLQNLFPKIQPLGVRDSHQEVLDRVTTIYFLQEGILEERLQQEKIDLDTSVKELGEILEIVEAELTLQLERADLKDELELIERMDVELNKIEDFIKAAGTKSFTYVETYGLPVATKFSDALALKDTKVVNLDVEEVQLGSDEVLMTGDEEIIPLKAEDLEDIGVDKTVGIKQAEEVDLDRELQEIEEKLEDLEEEDDEIIKFTQEEDVTQQQKSVIKDIIEERQIPKPGDKPKPVDDATELSFEELELAAGDVVLDDKDKVVKSKKSEFEDFDKKKYKDSLKGALEDLVGDFEDEIPEEEVEEEEQDDDYEEESEEKVEIIPKKDHEIEFTPFRDEVEMEMEEIDLETEELTTDQEEFRPNDDELEDFEYNDD